MQPEKREDTRRTYAMTTKTAQLTLASLLAVATITELRPGSQSAIHFQTGAFAFDA
jgi:hypothetical protein